MWIPHFLLEFWEPETSAESVQVSERDISERKFELWFFLEDPPTRVVQDSGLALAAPEQRTQTDGTGRSVGLRFEPNEKGRLGSVAFKVTDTSAKAAFRYCYDRLCQLLSFWAITAGTGFGIFGLRVIDDKHGAKWKVIPQRTVPEPFYLPLGIAVGDKHAAMMSLYREGRNTPSPLYRFLCFYKILEAWYQHGNVFGAADRLIRERNLPFRRPRRIITHDMLVLSLVFNRYPEFEGRSFAEFFNLLNPYRVKVAHAITDAGTFVDLDKYESTVELAPTANLTDLVARQVLLDEFELWRHIQEAGHAPDETSEPHFA